MEEEEEDVLEMETDVEMEGVKDDVALVLVLREAEVVIDFVVERVDVREGVVVEERVGLREVDGDGEFEGVLEGLLEIEGVLEGLLVLDGVVHCLSPG